MEKLIDLHCFPVKTTLKILLTDRTTGENIIWATDNYSKHGDKYKPNSLITEESLLKLETTELQPRVFKSIEIQKLRTKTKAEVYTPKKIVVKMIKLLEENNPGCFDDEKTFIDIYMKSGLFITEIVKKLYRSEKMKELYPDDHERLKHIFENQVYGLAPTEIIYKIAINFIFGSELTKDINTSHFVIYDAQHDAETGTLKQKLDKIFTEDTCE